MGQETVDDFEGVDVLLLSGAAARPDQCLIIAAASCRALSPSLFATGLVFKSSKLIANVTVVWMHLLLKQSTQQTLQLLNTPTAHTTLPVTPALVIQQSLCCQPQCHAACTTSAQGGYVQQQQCLNNSTLHKVLAHQQHHTVRA